MSARSIFFLSIYYILTKRCLGNDLDIAKSGPEMNFILQSIAIDCAAAKL